MAMAPGRSKAGIRLPPEVNRILFVRNLPFKINSEDIYDLFGKYGAVRQVRLGNTNETRGTGFVVYEDIFDAKSACEHLQGFNIQGRYLVVLYHQPAKQAKKIDNVRKEADLEELKRRHNIADA
ncbi:hypothetical protein DSO57_1023463 [Entomophthora muscae]|uniref:Uncharacterized protein n=1 Tax=Entomophthora muscae TaxID=34485 RepID=A0ACC2RTZ3_9FUNG|nr:hypothetical protein DSO57_1023463 [Entomophthora muscae]